MFLSINDYNYVLEISGPGKWGSMRRIGWHTDTTIVHYYIGESYDGSQMDYPVAD